MRGDAPNEVPLTREERCYQKSHLQFTRIQKIIKWNVPINVGPHYLMNRFIFLLCSSLFNIDGRISLYVFLSSFTSVKLITNFFHGHGQNQHISRTVCEIDLEILPPFPGTVFVKYGVVCFHRLCVVTSGSAFFSLLPSCPCCGWLFLLSFGRAILSRHTHFELCLPTARPTNARAALYL